MTISEIVALASVLISVGMNVGLYVHLSSTMNARFDGSDRHFESIERRLELIQGDLHQMDIRLTRLEK
jgi:hypothetical protein